MDIRKFFTPKSSDKKTSSTKSINGDKKGNRKRIFIESDSDEEPIKTPKRKTTDKSIKSSAKKAKEETKSKYFEVDKNKVKSLFGTDPVKQTRAPSKPDKTMVAENELADVSLAFLDDEDDWVQDVTSPKNKKETQVAEASQNFHSMSPGSTPVKISPRTESPSRSPSLSPPKKRKMSVVRKDHELSPEPLADEDVPPTTNKKPIEKKVSPKVFSKPETSKISKQNGITGSKPSSLCSTTSSKTPSVPQMKNPKFELWVEKYKPNSLKQIIGQQGDKSNVQKLVKWLKAWHRNQSGKTKIPKPSPWAKDDDGAFFKAALLSGPPGVGKTTTAHLVCKEVGMDAVEFNASDTRSKKLLHQEITELLTSNSLSPFVQGGSATSRNHVLIMDEVDGMAGNEDRGGIQELISLIKNSKVPIICMCNDRNHPKIRSLVNYCFDLRFSKPRAEQIKGTMMSICFKEGLKIKPDVLSSIIASTNQDIRLVLNHLSMLAAKHDTEMMVSNKELKLGAWDVLKKVFSETEHKAMSIYDKLDLFFHDYSIAPLFVQENYLNVVPHSEVFKKKTTKMDLFAQAASSLCNGDLVDRAIRSQNAWALLPTQAVFSSLVPGELLSGHMGGMINFPTWLGKNSKKNKMDRLAQEIQAHTRLRASASNEAVRLDYARALRDSILAPLVSDGSNGVDRSLNTLREYSLLREDIESLNELALWPGCKDPMSTIEAKVKAAFTRAYNKNPVLTPFSISGANVKKSRSGQDTEALDNMYEDEESAIVGDDDEEETDPVADGMIMAKKKTSSKPEASKEPKKKKDSAVPSKPRGRGRSGKK